jgi:hypothetical protein
VTGAPVEFTAEGRSTTVATDSSGRAQTSGWARGARVTVGATVDGERLESQPILVADVGVRVMLVAGVADRMAPGAARPAAAKPGTVVLGPQSRVVMDFVDDRLRVFYVMDVFNASPAPVDLGGPLVVELPRTARGVTMLEGTSKQATASGPRVTVTGPFQPGSTMVSVGFELPHGGPRVRLEQTWPVPADTLDVFVLKTGELDIESPQLTSRRLAHEQGQPVVAAAVPDLGPGQPLVLDVTGLPFHPRWPRYTAFAAAGLIVSWGLWAAFVPARRRAA